MLQPNHAALKAGVMSAYVPPSEALRLYSDGFFGPDWLVPEVQFVEANSDDEALAAIRSMRPSLTREVWQSHRLVRVLPPKC